MRAGEPVELLSSALIGLLQNKQENWETKIIHLKLIKAVTGRSGLFKQEPHSPVKTLRLDTQALLSPHG